jgi:hypothetical protein
LFKQVASETGCRKEDRIIFFNNTNGSFCSNACQYFSSFCNPGYGIDAAQSLHGLSRGVVCNDRLTICKMVLAKVKYPAIDTKTPPYGGVLFGAGNGTRTPELCPVYAGLKAVV